MTFQPLSIAKEHVDRAQFAARRWAPRLSDTMQSALVKVFGATIAVTIPAILSLNAIGMSRQDLYGTIRTGSAVLVAIVFSAIILRRLLSFPLLRTSTFVAVTFVSTFATIAESLKLLNIVFSTHQLFLSMIIMMGVTEGWLAVQRRWKLQNIAVVPGGLQPARLPHRPSRPITLTFLSEMPFDHSQYDGVVADLRCNLGPGWENFLAVAALRGIPVYHIKQFNELITGRVAVDHLWENTLGAMVPSLIYPQFKRMFDILAAIAALPIIVPIVAVAAALIKRESSGPVFYRQQRIGYGCKPFTIFKLRTMTDGADEREAPETAYTRPADPRITQIGLLLRKYRIDELPQVINILKGDMSWIGPRPEAITLAEWYQRDVAFYVYRHIVRPGISGWAQVNQGNVGAVDAAREKLEYDFFYIKHFSFWIDSIIFIKTIRTLLTGSGAR